MDALTLAVTAAHHFMTRFDLETWQQTNPLVIDWSCFDGGRWYVDYKPTFVILAGA